MGSKRSNEHSGLSKEEYDRLMNTTSSSSYEQDTGGRIPRADDSILQQRRLVKVRTPTTTTTSVSSSNPSSAPVNPFASVTLKASSSTSAVAATTKPLSSLLFGNSNASTGSNKTSTTNADNNTSSQSTTVSSTALEVIKKKRLKENESMIKNLSLKDSFRKSWDDPIKSYLSAQLQLDLEQISLMKAKNSGNVNRTSSSSAETPVASNRTTASVGLFGNFGSATTTTAATSTTSTTATGTGPLFGSFAPPPPQRPNPIVFTPNNNMFGQAPTTTATASSNNGNEDDDNVVEPENPNDAVQRSNDPNWEDIGEYSNVQFYHSNVRKDNKMESFMKNGSVRLQKNITSNAFCINSWNANGKALINIRIHPKMSFTLTVSTNKKNNTKFGQIFFKGRNYVGSDNDQLFAMTIMNEAQAQELYNTLQELASTAAGGST